MHARSCASSCERDAERVALNAAVQAALRAGSPGGTKPADVDLLGARVRAQARRPRSSAASAQPLQRIAQGLAALAERGAHDAREALPDRRRRSRSAARGTSRTTAESTFGGGRNAPGGTLNSGVDAAVAPAASRSGGRRPCCPAPAAMRSTTSFCSMKCMSRIAVGVVERMEQDRRGEVVGQVADQAHLAAPSPASAVKSTVSTSAMDHRQLAVRAARLRSAATIRSRSNSMTVSAPWRSQQREGDRALAGTDLDQAIAGLRIDRLHDLVDDRRARAGSAGRGASWAARAGSVASHARLMPAHARRATPGDAAQVSTAANRLDGSAVPRAGQVQRRAVVDRDARIGQAEREVHRAARSRCT